MLLKKEIQDFVIVSKYLNLSKASDFLSVNQSGLSKSIQKLERSLGFPLFFRRSRGLELTKEGEIFKNSCLEVEKLWVKTENELGLLKNTVTGKIQIGCHPVIGKYFIPKLKKELSHYQQLDLVFEFDTSRKVTEYILNSEMDFAVVVDPQKYPDLRIKKLWSESIGLYSLSGKEQNEILFHEKMINVHKILPEFKDCKKQRIDDYDTIRSVLKRSSNSMGLLPSPVGEKEAKLKEIKSFKPQFEVSLVYLPAHCKTKAHKVIIEAFKSLWP